MAASKKLSFFGILILTSKYLWFTDLISTVILRFSSDTSFLPKPVILFIMIFRHLQSMFLRISYYYRIPHPSSQGLFEWGGDGGMRSFVCCVPSAISLMKWSADEGKQHGCGFREHRTGCPLLPARPFEHRISISLVKSDGKLKTKLRLPPAPPLSPSPAPSAFLPPRHTIRHH